MGNRFFFRPALLALIIFSLFTLPLSAQGFFSKVSWLVDGSILFFPEDNGKDSDPMPILPSFGVGASYPVIENKTINLALELTMDFYMTHYGYDDYLDRAVPNSMENRTARVLGSLFTFQAAGSFNAVSFMAIRFFAGLTADLRIVFMAAGLSAGEKDDASKQTNKVRRYFWSGGRWFMPVTGVGTDFILNDRFKLGVDFRVWMPLYRIWTGEDLPGIEGWRFGVGFRLTIH